MKLRFPWAKRFHFHPQEPRVGAISVCAGCGHLVFHGHKENKIVWCMDRRRGTLTYHKTYGKSCAPEWDTEEIGLDGEVRYFKGNKRVA